jgi:hypothetical protein
VILDLGRHHHLEVVAAQEEVLGTMVLGTVVLGAVVLGILVLEGVTSKAEVLVDLDLKVVLRVVAVGVVVVVAVVSLLA